LSYAKHRGEKNLSKKIVVFIPSKPHFDLFYSLSIHTVKLQSYFMARFLPYIMAQFLHYIDKTVFV